MSEDGLMLLQEDCNIISNPAVATRRVVVAIWDPTDRTKPQRKMDAPTPLSMGLDLILT